ncbi:YbaB/EbfC family nucleoid-associated protein [Micromonospora sp. WMMD1155]|uniref:YbaB/EbfC family nucleoid-associated protein n=1 Tax=Micromonospora sp. WMMD1155 TaxID=3016094 RepID=UPI00249CB8D5|nr:YbaB/EbfC family nucleoid-associated protein [Micromonospora sp. WMMD1155]WFE48811.1 YbaB/EbfC family nucleoid-associated protein [Micromonospora sp. WMMD1155]
MSINQEQLNHLRQQALALQAEVANVQEAMNATEVTGVAADGQVTVTMTAAGEFLSVHLDPNVLEDNPADEVEALILAALRDATAQLKDHAAQRTGAISSVLDRLRAS